MIKLIDTPAARIVVTAPVSKLCPVADEVDVGSVTLTYRTDGTGPELHALADYLAGYADEPLTHEEFVNRVARDTGAHVSSVWTTAGMRVECSTIGGIA